MYIAICGVNDGYSATRLCLIDDASLDIQQQSEQILSDSSDLLEVSGTYYAVIRRDQNCFVAAFDKNLTLLKSSSLTVSPSTPLTSASQGIFVSGADGNPHLLNSRTLETIW